MPSVMSFFFSPLVMVDYVPLEVLEKEGHLPGEQVGQNYSIGAGLTSFRSCSQS